MPPPPHARLPALPAARQQGTALRAFAVVIARGEVRHQQHVVVATLVVTGVRRQFHRDASAVAGIVASLAGRRRAWRGDCAAALVLLVAALVAAAAIARSPTPRRCVASVAVAAACSGSGSGSGSIHAVHSQSDERAHIITGSTAQRRRVFRRQRDGVAAAVAGTAAAVVASVAAVAGIAAAVVASVAVAATVTVAAVLAKRATVARWRR